MQLHDWLDAEPGRAARLALDIGRSKTAVSLWREAGVPMELIPKIAELSGGAVTVDAMLRHAMERRTARAKPEEAPLESPVTGFDEKHRIPSADPSVWPLATGRRSEPRGDNPEKEAASAA